MIFFIFLVLSNMKILSMGFLQFFTNEALTSRCVEYPNFRYHNLKLIGVDAGQKPRTKIIRLGSSSLNENEFENNLLPQSTSRIQTRKGHLKQQYLSFIQRASYLSFFALTSSPQYRINKDSKQILTSLLQPAEAAVKGFTAVESLYAPGKVLYNNMCPILPQSALLNSLNYIDNQNIYDLISEMQNYLESFVQLINPSSSKQLKQIQNPDSILWNNLRLNAQRAAGMFIYNRDEIFLASTIRNMSNTNIDQDFNKFKSKSNSNSRISFEKQQKAQYRRRYLNNLKYDVLNLVKASSRSDSIQCLRYMRNSLNSLLEVAYLYTPFSVSSAHRVIRTDPPYVANLPMSNKLSKKSITPPTLTTISEEAAENSKMIDEIDVIDEINNSNNDEFLVSNNKNFDRQSIVYETTQLDLRSKLSRLPKLIGRARVTLYIQRPGSDSTILSKSNSNNNSGTSSAQIRSPRLVSDGSSKKNLFSTVKLVVDGINHPYTAGNFIDLCQKGFYDNTVINKTSYSSGGRGSTSGAIKKKNKDSKNRPLPLETKKFYKNYSNNTNVSSIIFPNQQQQSVNNNNQDITKESVMSTTTTTTNKENQEKEEEYDKLIKQNIFLNNVNMTLFGTGVYGNIKSTVTVNNGYVDPTTGRLRRVPLEILRQNITSSTTSITSNKGSSSFSNSKSNSNSKISDVTNTKENTDTVTDDDDDKLEDYVIINNDRYIATSFLHNTDFYTKAEPVLSFATYGAIGMYHNGYDRNGASSTFFYVSPQSDELNLFERHSSPVIDRLNNYYSLFAYVIEGLDVLEQLREGDVLVSTIIEDNAWELEQPNE